MPVKQFWRSISILCRYWKPGGSLFGQW